MRDEDTVLGLEFGVGSGKGNVPNMVGISSFMKNEGGGVCANPACGQRVSTLMPDGMCPACSSARAWTARRNCGRRSKYK